MYQPRATRERAMEVIAEGNFDRSGSPERERERKRERGGQIFRSVATIKLTL